MDYGTHTLKQQFRSSHRNAPDRLRAPPLCGRMLWVGGRSHAVGRSDACCGQRLVGLPTQLRLLQHLHRQNAVESAVSQAARSRPEAVWLRAKWPGLSPWEQ